MAKIIITHGLVSSSKAGLVSYLAKEYSRENHEVITPDFPFAIIPNPLWDREFRNAVGIPDTNTYFINISTSWVIGAHYLDSVENIIGGAAMITPFLDIDYHKVRNDFMRSMKHFDFEEKKQDVMELTEHFKISPTKDYEHLKNLLADMQHFALKGLLTKPFNLERVAGRAIKKICIGSSDDPYISRDQLGIISKKLNADAYEMKNAGHLTGFYYEKFPQVKDITDRMVYDV